MEHRFEIDSKEALPFLEEQGYLVVKNVLSAAEIAHAKDLCWKFLEDGFGARRNDVSTWGVDNWAARKSAGIGLMNDFGFGQSEFCWYIRDRPKVKQAFEMIWDTPKLLVSFDGGSLFRPWQYNEDWKTRGGWWHVDQNPIKKPGRHCIQGLVTLYDATEQTGGLAVIPGSHLAHDSLYRAHAAGGIDFVSLDESLEVPPGKLVTGKAGDLLLWDSRTSHCNQPASETPPRPADGEQWELLRMVAYVCMTPRSKASKEVIEKRKEAVKLNLGSTHWPHEYRSHGGGDPKSPPEIEFSRNQLELIGYTQNEIDGTSPGVLERLKDSVSSMLGVK